MRKLLAVALFLSSLPGLAQTGSVVFNWTGTGNPSIPACSTTVTTSCLTTFSLADITNGAQPIVLSSIIPVTTLIYTLSPLPSVGSHIYGLEVLGKDQSGNPISSAPVILNLTIPAFTLNPPTGFTGTP